LVDETKIKLNKASHFKLYTNAHKHTKAYINIQIYIHARM